MKPSDLTDACIAQMEISSWLNCFVKRCEDSARAEAEAADLRQANGEDSIVLHPTFACAS